MNKIFCEHCKKEIENQEFRVTFKEHSILPIQIDLELNFHRQCWTDKYNQSIDDKVRYMAKQIMKNAQPMIKEFAQRRVIA